MLPLGGPSALKENRKTVVSGLNFTQAATFIGDFQYSADDFLLLDDAAEWHNNHASDPASGTLNMSQTAAVNIERSLVASDTVSFTSFAHAALEGYTPGGGGSGDPDLNKHIMIAAETLVIGNPVYVSSSNSVTSANADAGSPIPYYTRCYPVGFANSNASTSNDVEVLTEGSITLADWTAITGNSSLVTGTKYFLDTTSGKMTYIAPTGDGQVVVMLGRALTSTKFDIEIGEGVIL